MEKDTIDGLFLELDSEEMELYKNVSANAFFKYVYNSEQFQSILNKLDTNEKLTDEEWKYILGRLFLVTSRSTAEYKKNKLGLKDKLLKLLCRIGMFFAATDSSWYNEFYKMFEFIGSFKKLKLVSSDLYGCFLLVDEEKNEDLLKIYIDQHKDAYDFRDYRKKFMDCFIENNQRALDDVAAGMVDREVGTVAGDERTNINMMNRSFDKSKELVLRYNEWYNTNIDCEEE